jgi:hypothetical protein
MQWSKLKSRIKDFICPELCDRIDFHLTSYRKSHDGADKVWITVDGEKVFSFEHYPYERAEAEAYWQKLDTAQVKNHLQANEIHNPPDFGNAMRLYLDMPIAEALNSSNPIIKALAIIDRRTGKRTLESLEINESAHSLVKDFYKLRIDKSETRTE